MTTTDLQTQFYTDLLNAKKEFPKLVFDSKNPHFKNSYISLSGILSSIEEILHAHNLFIIHFQKHTEGGFLLETVVQHTNGLSIKTEIFISTMGKNDQGVGSAMSYARRYSLCALLALAADDEDGEADRLETLARTYASGSLQIELYKTFFSKKNPKETQILVSKGANHVKETFKAWLDNVSKELAPVAVVEQKKEVKQEVKEAAVVTDDIREKYYLALDKLLEKHAKEDNKDIMRSFCMSMAVSQSTIDAFERVIADEDPKKFFDLMRNFQTKK